MQDVKIAAVLGEAVRVGSWHNPDLPGRLPAGRYRVITGP